MQQIDEFRRWLEETGRSPNTVRVYAHAAEQWRLSGKSPDVFLSARCTPGNARVRAAALRAWSTWQGTPLPAYRVGRVACKRPGVREVRAPDVKALADYHELVEACVHPVCRAVLHVLPLAGVRLGVLCASPWDGPEPWRKSTWVEDYVAFQDPGPFLFPADSPRGHIRAAEVTRALRRLDGAPSWTPDALWKLTRDAIPGPSSPGP